MDLVSMLDAGGGDGRVATPEVAGVVTVRRDEALLLLVGRGLAGIDGTRGGREVGSCGSAVLVRFSTDRVPAEPIAGDSLSAPVDGSPAATSVGDEASAGIGTALAGGATSAGVGVYSWLTASVVASNSLVTDGSPPRLLPKTPAGKTPWFVVRPPAGAAIAGAAD
jgi:hypothetical protein